jgi:hypothetical protein
MTPILIPEILYCPKCNTQHIDEGEWATRPHKTHQCQSCFHEWRPFEWSTVGVQSHPSFDLITHLYRQQRFSEKTFGPGERSKGVCNHIRKELVEIENKPHDLEEWIDVILLACDGARRVGYTPEQIAAQLEAKLTKNEQRVWPDWRTMSVDDPIEHTKDENE